MPPFFSRIAAALISLCAFLFIGCGGGSSEVPQAASRTQAQAQLERAFAKADPQLRAEAAKALDALKTDNLKASFEAVRALKNRPGLTAEQEMAIRNTSLGLQAELAERIVAGDKESLALAERLRNN
ncbi:MAG TPA: hypothetical protein VHB20_00405 [Verrucomicrobiae bacterium]|nr:hypothetical protein [Verrucomicrobiae bacterium]